MSLVHYFFGEEGEKISKHLLSHNISTDIVVERFTNLIVKNCLANSTKEAWEKVLRAYDNIEEDFDYRKHFDQSILIDYKKYTSDEEVLKIDLDEKIANITYELGEKFKNTASIKYDQKKKQETLSDLDFTKYPKQIACLYLS